MKPFFRKLHRWLGLLMALQILAWMASGLYFAVFPIETIRGEHLTVPDPSPSADQLAATVPPAVAWAAVTDALDGPASLTGLELVNRLGDTWYRVSGIRDGQSFIRLVHATEGWVLPRLDEAAVRAHAESYLAVSARVQGVEWIESVGAHSEIRGRALPVWKVSFSEPEALAMYFHPWTGDLLARRTTRWRIFDFLWMLHIMDFETRDDFNTPLLQIAAGLGFVVALSGLVFWAMTSRLFRRRSKPSRA